MDGATENRQAIFHGAIEDCVYLQQNENFGP